ncbi:alpha/beta-hydrolase [Marasmius fiardii PR-910]|nr:alpha/beta-hydrolase [Marasmius fiardii PR-910]
MFSVLPTSLSLFLSSLIWKDPETTSQLHFQLRHTHAMTNHSRIIFSDQPAALAPEIFSIDTTSVTTYRPPSFSAFSDARYRSLRRQESEPLTWSPTEVPGPDVRKREVLQLLAKMTANAYSQPGDKSWYDLGPDWNQTYPYGWEPDADGFRGHVFVSTDNSTVVVSVKGTSVPWISGGPTTAKDKLNDNLLFSCCCARVGPTWSTVCGCYEGGYKCNTNCLEESLAEESLFYPIGTNLYNNITYMYPEANIWMVGHSLGGSLASLIGVTFGVPVVAFQAPGEQMASRRLHLPSPPSTQHVTHVINNADPIAMGVCNGVSSSCASAGYAMESRCHLGNIILFNTVEKLGWSSNVMNHGIVVVIDKVLGDETLELPEPTPEIAECWNTECTSWTFEEGNTTIKSNEWL